MQNFFDVVQNRNGLAIEGGLIYVYNSLGVLATLYSDNGVTTKNNPTATNIDGEYSFYAANGTYSLTISAYGYTSESRTGVVLYDPADAGAVVISGGTINATPIGATTPSMGSFTTLSASGTTTLSGGTANGVTYLNASKQLTSGSGLVFDGANLGIGTSVPGYKLDVSGAINAQQARIYNTAATALHLVNATSGLTYSLYSANSASNGFNGFGIFDGTAYRLMLDASGNTTPGTDNTQTLGSAANRWSVVYAGTGTINTSDAREKTPVSALTAAELAAAQALAAEIGTYQFLSAVADKGSAARCHVGMTVQRAIEIMQAHQLNPMRYGFVCHDVWDATYEDQVSDAGSLSRQVQRQVTVAQEQHSTRIEIIDGKPVQVRDTTVVQVPQTDLLPVLDEVGQPVLVDGQALTHPVPRMETITERYDRIETRPAGDRYSFRPDELLLFILRGMVGKVYK